MFTSDQYELLDFGDGRKLERFGDVTVDRPSPPAESMAKAAPELWRQANARFQRTSGLQGEWAPKDALPQHWAVRHKQTVFRLKPTPTGQLGVFVEQARNWDWIERRIRQTKRTLKVLNLFAYTGGSTLAAASAGAEVTHIDAARGVVGWARENATDSGLAEAPIRWITEDATRFVERECRRENVYDALILDPPSYGHGPKGEDWKIERDLPGLLRKCRELTQGRLAFLLLTCHSPGLGPAELEALVSDIFFGHCGAGAEAQDLFISDDSGAKLPAGAAVRWPR